MNYDGRITLRQVKEIFAYRVITEIRRMVKEGVVIYATPHESTPLNGNVIITNENLENLYVDVDDIAVIIEKRSAPLSLKQTYLHRLSSAVMQTTNGVSGNSHNDGGEGTIEELVETTVAVKAIPYSNS
jgi:hypothetical protein